MVTVLQTDPLMDRYRDLLTAGGGHAWTFASGWSPEEQIEALGTTEVLVAASLPLSYVPAAKSLKLIHVTGAGYDKIPLDLLGPDVRVANTFHHGPSIAEHVLAAAVLLTRQTPRSDAAFRQGVWRSVLTDPAVPLGSSLRDRTFGLIGLGEIGSSVAGLAAAFGARVVSVRSSSSAADLDELLSTSDVIVVTAPLTDATRGMIGVAQYALMRPHAILINVARGPLLDEAATFEALSTGRIAGAALDVWWGHPRLGTPPTSYDFAALPNVLLTPHQAGHTDDTFRARAADIAANIDAFAAGLPLRNVVR